MSIAPSSTSPELVLQKNHPDTELNLLSLFRWPSWPYHKTIKMIVKEYFPQLQQKQIHFFVQRTKTKFRTLRRG